MDNLGTYSVIITDNGKGVTFTAKPTPVGIVILIIFLLFPPYTLLLCLTVHALLGNRYFGSRIDPLLSIIFDAIQHGSRMTLEIAKELIEDMTKHEEEPYATETKHEEEPYATDSHHSDDEELEESEKPQNANEAENKVEADKSNDTLHEQMPESLDNNIQDNLNAKLPDYF